MSDCNHDYMSTQDMITCPTQPDPRLSARSCLAWPAALNSISHHAVTAEWAGKSRLGRKAGLVSNTRFDQ